MFFIGFGLYLIYHPQDNKQPINTKTDDIDIATALTIDSLKQKFKDTNFKVIDTGLKHGTVTIVSENYKVELTTLRKDIKTDGRHAKVKFTKDWFIDSNRRDLTINALSCTLNGRLYDYQPESAPK